MLLKQVIELADILDSPSASGAAVEAYLSSIDPEADVTVYALEGPKGKTDVVKVRVPGIRGKSAGGSAPTIGLLGRLGGLGARPERIGFVSDGDGALCALAIAAKLLDMKRKGDRLEGDVFISTHVCPNAPTRPHTPVPFMDSPGNMGPGNPGEGSDDLDAILSVDTTKGNKIINTRDFSISPTVMQGYILKVSSDLVDLMEITLGKPAHVFPLSQQDITPYGNDLYHLNSILQPSTATKAPVVGVAITAATAVPGCATGASHVTDIEEAARFMLEAAKAFGRGELSFYDEKEFAHLQKLYGYMSHFQGFGRQ